MRAMKRSSSSSQHSRPVRISIFLLSFLLWQNNQSSPSTTNALLVAPSAAAKQWVTTSPPGLSSISSSSSSSTSSSSSSSSTFPPASSSSSSAFVIERLSDHAPPHVFSKIAKMCINVFFNQGRGPGVYIPPWQQAQLTYLQHMQAADLQQRRYSQQQIYQYASSSSSSSSQLYHQQLLDNNYDVQDFQEIWYDDTNPEISYSRRSSSSKSSSSSSSPFRRQPHHHVEYNDMFVAYQVIRAEPQVARRKPLLLDLTNVYNAPSSQQEPSPWQVYHDDDDVEYVRGELLGFCEVTERYFGLDYGHQLSRPLNSMYPNEQNSPPSFLCAAQVRPILTNLAVKPKARHLGIGSALVQACEETVIERGRFQEVVLEVEAENTKALAFYQKRGYQVLYQDPACRRYDVQGLLLRKVPCTRIVMRKCLYPDEETMNKEGGEYNQQQTNHQTSSSSSSTTTTSSFTSASSRMVSSLASMWQRLRDKSLSYIHV